ncbi:MAG: 5-dehydro-4-deoxy-D-glucuronate isomerase [Atribacterota bacterium]|nr:5-dehydro-4-deoxy-D-glucuronate isomerase [Atribacterota bacterium]MDD5636964.1 5-dehydro-4-deoxy-D-glucuronate isomerase [Atribacterota bacterium]
MEIRYAVHPDDFIYYDTELIREEFLIQNLFTPGQINMVYSHNDRIIIGGLTTIDTLSLEAGKDIKADYFLERREMGIINIGGKGAVTVDGEKYTLENQDGLYIGMGSKEILFSGLDPQNPSKFYFNSATAHYSYPTQKIAINSVEAVHLGSIAESNERTIYKYIHPEGVKSCQLVMGMTILEPGNVWNTMSCHTHERRMEVYLYFNMPESRVVFHLMGRPSETRHITVRNEEAVISPSWSIHSGVGTGNYTFIWGMVGENQAFGDMDDVEMDNLQ